ncbi:hypothetical protein [Embleya sp. NBC_00896]|uniref:hypothetical protein n=1 Tax=Embleya sp. NBC_00896 TaxID=2975961 RepID=UPI00386324BF|nr:hypothetical protein OG928_18670 [Embleya sp. NBC_00896]
MAISSEIEMSIVGSLYVEAERLGWTYLPDGERTAAYDRWVADPEIGGRLTLFLKTPEKVRVWLKDGPMKERARAVYGHGKYASLVPNPAKAVNNLVIQALDADWVPDLETVRIKPMRLIARKGDDEIRFTWGPARDLKHLVWAALNAKASGDAIPWVLCVVGSFVKPTPDEERNHHVRIAECAGLRLAHVVGD